MVEGVSLVEVVRTNVAKWSEGGEIMIICSSKLYCTPNAYIVLFLFTVYNLFGKNKQTNKQTNKQANKQANFTSTFCCRWRGGRDRWFCPAQLQEVVSAGPDFHCRHHLAWYGGSSLALKLSYCVTSHTLASLPGS